MSRARISAIVLVLLAALPEVVLACPVCFVLGGKDAMTPAKAASGLIAACANASVVTIPGAGHNVMAERPDAVLDVLRQFLSPLSAKT